MYQQRLGGPSDGDDEFADGDDDDSYEEDDDEEEYDDDPMDADALYALHESIVRVEHASHAPPRSGALGALAVAAGGLLAVAATLGLVLVRTRWQQRDAASLARML